VTASKIEQDLKMFLPSYMRPHIQIVQEIPLLFNGKVDREFLMKAYEENHQRQGMNIIFRKLWCCSRAPVPRQQTESPAYDISLRASNGFEQALMNATTTASQTARMTSGRVREIIYPKTGPVKMHVFSMLLALVLHGVCITSHN